MRIQSSSRADLARSAGARGSLRDVGRYAAAVDEREVRVDAERRLRRVALGVEQVEGVDAARRDPELGGRGVEVDGAGLLRVQAADVDHQLPVDEHPNIVVALEREILTARVLEASVKLGREA